MPQSILEAIKSGDWNYEPDNAEVTAKIGFDEIWRVYITSRRNLKVEGEVRSTDHIILILSSLREQFKIVLVIVATFIFEDVLSV